MTCTKCDLHKTCKTVQMKKEGVGDIVFLGEAPGEEEDRSGKPFVGKSGQLLRKMMEDLDIEKSRFRITNAVRCRPPNNRTPSKKEIRTCLDHMIDEFIENPPSIIVPLGNTALDALRLAGLLSVPGKIMSLHGKVIEEDGLIILPILHPAYVLRNPQYIPMMASINVIEEIVKDGVKEKSKIRYEFSEDISELISAIEKANLAGIVTYDIETATLHPKEKVYEADDRSPLQKIICFSLTWEERQAFGFALTPDNREKAWDTLHSMLLENRKVRKIIQHAKFEVLWSMATGRSIWNIHDTMLQHWHVDEKNGTHGLGKLALTYTDMGFYDSPLENYKKQNKLCDPSKTYKDPETKEVRKGSYENIPLDILLPYNCADTDATFRIHNKLYPALNDKQLWVYNNIQLPAVYPLAEMELSGALLDWDYAKLINKQIQNKIEQLEEEIRSYPEVQQLEEDIRSSTGDSINFDSPRMISELLFNYIGMKPLYKTASGKADSTDKHVLEYLAQKHPVPKLLIDRRSLRTLNSTFVEAAFEKSFDGRLHTSYGMAHTETGRLNSKNPNLQNIPRDDTSQKVLQDVSIKKMYIPEPGHWMLQVDYSQIELRVLAIFSKDETLLNYFRNGADVHRMIAAQIHQKSPLEVTKTERTHAKRTVFGLCYGQSAKGISEELGISEVEAEIFLKKFFNAFPGVRRWMLSTEKQATETGQVESMFGTRRRLPDATIKRREDPMRNRALRQAINFPIQGTAAKIMEMKIAELWTRLRELSMGTKMILTVHDSLLLSVPDEELKLLIELVKNVLEDFSKIPWVNIPILCDMEIGDRWGDLISIDAGAVNAIIRGEEITKVLSDVLVEKC